VSWILIAVGSLLLSIAVLTVQYIMTKTLSLGPMPGAAILDACSMIPVATGGYSTTPSLWMALSSFFATYIIVNAANIYSMNPSGIAKEALPVQQRKGLGLISMLATVLLFLFLIVPRYTTGCETMVGSILGLGMGVIMGWAWWRILEACGSDVFPDIHGVMIGLKPGQLRSNPMACPTA
jgi:hypothetical protein